MAPSLVLCSKMKIHFHFHLKKGSKWGIVFSFGIWYLNMTSNTLDNGTTAGNQSSCHATILSCCQGLPSCSRPAQNWLLPKDSSGFSFCRHGSNGFYGAIREDNHDLVHFFLTSLTHSQLLECFNRETCFGDTFLIFAAALGRVGIAKSLLNFLENALSCSGNSSRLLLSDYVDYESSRGKMAIVESIRGKHTEMTDLLLSFHATMTHSSKFYKITPLEWGRILGQTELVDRINQHLTISDNVIGLMIASSRHDIDAVCRFSEASCSSALYQ